MAQVLSSKRYVQCFPNKETQFLGEKGVVNGSDLVKKSK